MFEEKSLTLEGVDYVVKVADTADVVPFMHMFTDDIPLAQEKLVRICVYTDGELIGDKPLPFPVYMKLLPVVMEINALTGKD